MSTKQLVLTREERRRRRLELALERARRRLAETSPEHYAEERYYRAVRTNREHKVRLLERALRGEL